ncbi:MAG: patatin-like phospholipase family protein [Desulfobulbaceae bacterium]|nr:patatin-like phospholipase family protein [Desulfobulbaceae bacterium]
MKKTNGKSWLVAAFLLICFLLQGLQTSAVNADNRERPKIGLVLSGGGARGAAHIGVLKVLEELRVPIDYITGTSMGSIVGGLYASGMSPAEIESTLTSVDWDDTLQDTPLREDRSFRRKQDDYLYLMRKKPGFNDGKLELPTGFIQGQKIDLLFNSLTLPLADIDHFDNLDIPFRAVATDIVTGNPVILDSGNLALAMRASMSVPAAFAVVEIGGHMLVDGGVSNNLPINVAREMGADVIIAVDISTPLQTRNELTDAVSITAQLTGLLTRRNSEEQLATLTERDILVLPKLGNITSADFKRAGEAIPKGIAAAEMQRSRLEKLSLPQVTYEAHIAKRGIRQTTPPVIDFVEIDNNSRVGDDVLASYLNIETGKPLDLAQLEADIGRIYGLELFETVNYEIIRKNGELGLIIHAKERPWGPNYLQFGLASSNNFQGDNIFNLGFAYTRTAINRLAGEWRTALQIGRDPAVVTEWYQPLDVDSRYFINPSLFYRVANYSEFENGDRLAEYRTTRYGIGLAAGRELGTWGEFRLGYRRSAGEAEIRVGDPSVPDYDFDDGLVFARLSLDELNEVPFPTKGTSGTIEFISASETLGADSAYEQARFKLGTAKTWKRHTVIGSMIYDTTLDSDAPLESLFRAGGLFRLSGFNQDELSGQHFGFLGLAYFRRFGDFNLMPIYIGGSLEKGNVWNRTEDIDFDNTITAGSLFIGLDTPIGPFYLGYGLAEYNNDSLYLYMGKLF